MMPEEYEAYLLQQSQREAANSPWIGVPPTNAPPEGPALRRLPAIPADPPPPVPTAPPPQVGWAGREMGDWSNIGLQASRALMDVGVGLMSTRGDEHWGQGLARGIARGSESWLAEGRRQRRDAARRYYRERAEAGGPDATMWALMGEMELPRDAASLWSTTGGQQAATEAAMYRVRAADRRAEIDRSDRNARFVLGQRGADERARLGREATTGRWQAGREDPYSVERQEIATMRRASYDPEARRELFKMGFISEEVRDDMSKPLPKPLIDAIERDERQRNLFMDDLFRAIRAGQGGAGGGGGGDPTATPAPLR